ncbi:MAG: hypothetical protein L0I24_02125 [Pseudonocardia sp.]|nr:hypothetical protein [Pseudonocardia sp.]
MSSESPAERMRTALDLYEVGEGMMRARLRRERPDADDAEIDAAILAWLQHRPGAEFGDFPGPASTRRLPGR